jgi:hypothetical protein
MLAQQKQEIVALFQAALAPIVAGSDLTPNVVLERPRDPAHGDIACNIAMQLAKPLKTNPRELATRLVAALLADPKAAGPGRIGRDRRPRASSTCAWPRPPSSPWSRTVLPKQGAPTAAARPAPATT